MADLTVQAPPASPSPASPSPSSGGSTDDTGINPNTWLTTYCDMITLLCCFFILLLTFASFEAGEQQFPKKRDSLLYGTKGSGIVGKEQELPTFDSVIWREIPLKNHRVDDGSATPPLFSDPAVEPTAAALKVLEGPTLGTLEDSFAMRVGLPVLFDEAGQLTSSGQQILGALAKNLRHLPYDIHILVNESRHLPRAYALANHLMRGENLIPSRVGIGVNPGHESESPAVWFQYLRRP